jgi:hypothetical protein
MKTGLAFVGLFVALGALGCGSGGSALNEFGDKFKFTDKDVSGWKQDASDPAPYELYLADELVTKVDGGAQVYVDAGCQLIMYQTLAGTYPQTATVWAYDFATAAKAQAMFEAKKLDSLAATAIPPYDQSVAIGRASIVSIATEAHFNQYYFEVTVSGYDDQTVTCSACPMAAQLLGVLKTKSN